MSSSDYKEDLEYLYSALLCHPSILEDQRMQCAFKKLYLSIVAQEFEYDSFIDVATELTAFFQDGHTNIEIPYTAQDRCMKLKCYWNEDDCDELVLTERYENIPKHAKIFAVEDMQVSELIFALADRIPHENIYLVKSRMIMYPYQNYHVFSEINLKKLFGVKENYSVTFSVDGKLIKKDIPLVYYDGFLDFRPDDEFLAYEVSDDAVVMYLNQYICNEKYKQTLSELACICEEQEISSFVLDLSDNMGGDSSVIDEFIKYTRKKNYRRYEMIDFSSGKRKRMTSRANVVKNQQQDILLPEKIYCKVSHNTFSSARTFAVTLKDNGIATICGVPTGGKPNSYGMPKRMIMPKTNIRFRVSRACFFRSDVSSDEEITLMPELAKYSMHFRVGR